MPAPPRTPAASDFSQEPAMRLFPRFSLNRLRGARILDAVGEQLFQAPPFTPQVAESIGRISTRLRFRPDEVSRRLLECEANGMCEREWEALAPLFAALPRPQKILEVGPGFGRSVVYFRRKNLWDAAAEVHLYDTNGATTKYKHKFYNAPPQWPDVSSFCGDLKLLQSFLEFNQLESNQNAGWKIFDAATLPIRNLPGPYDLIYGFFSFGYHWSLDFYLDDFAPLMNERSVLICTLNKRFERFPRLGNYSTRVLECRDTKKKAPPLHLLALSKSPLPEVGRTLDEVYG
jgi:hypothetical protein